jgi:hypothetical protein
MPISEMEEKPFTSSLNSYPELVFVKLLRSPAIGSRRTGTTTLFDVPVCQARGSIRLAESIPGLNVHKFGLCCIIMRFPG